MPLTLSLSKQFAALCAPLPLGKSGGVLIARLLLIVLALVVCVPVSAQTFSVPQTTLGPANNQSFGGSTSRNANTVPGFAAPTFGAPNFRGTGPVAGTGFFGDTTPRIRPGSGGSLFDPYANGGGNTALGAGNFYPTPSVGAVGNGNAYSSIFGGGPSSFGPPTGGGSVFGSQAPPLFGSTAGAPSIFGGSPVVVPPNTYGAPTGFGSTIYPQSAIPSGSPSTLFPNGLFNGGGFGGFGGGGGGFGGAGAGGFFGGAGNTAFRLLQGPRFRHTFINSGNGQFDLETNDTDVSVAFAIPNFLTLQRPLFVVPSFSLHLWDGPQGQTGSDLPSRAYSAFLDFGWQTDPNQMLGVELGVRVGAFTDFDTFNSDTIRVLGKGLGSFRLTPFTTFKLGAYYINRNRIKLLPAGGFLWQPNANSRFDIFFPQPKIARYLRTVGTKDVWWYVSGDYGGGSWTVERDNGSEDSIDINDIRVTLGVEWGLTNLIRVGRRTGFAEIGYVFDREVLYDGQPGDNFETDDALLLRIGFGY